jgi:hypothetical protein
MINILIKIRFKNSELIYKFIFNFSLFNFKFIKLLIFMLGIGDWGLGIGDWGLGPIPNPQSPIPNPQSPFFVKKM